MTRWKILIVDDDPINLELLDRTLKRQDYDVIHAENGKIAVDKALEIHPDVVLMDAVMPEMDGFEATRRIKSDTRTQMIPVVMVTSLNDVEDRVRALDAGADDFLNKPFDRLELTARVRSLVQVKAYHDHLINHRKVLEDAVARRTEEVQNALNQLQEASLETIICLSRAAEYKDEDTAQHIERMSHYSRIIALHMGLDERIASDILHAAPMHDIGKIGIPDSILLKPGKLTPDEWIIMKSHVEIGARILRDSKSPIIQMGELIALSHHERWDGSGYPQGLAGTDIPLEGRIVAIADVFDALISKRPYKKAMSLDQCYHEISQSRGSHFDPDVCDAFFAVTDEILLVAEAFKDPDPPGHS